MSEEKYNVDIFNELMEVRKAYLNSVGTYDCMETFILAYVMMKNKNRAVDASPVCFHTDEPIVYRMK